jgi:hypothetical protein
MSRVRRAGPLTPAEMAYWRLRDLRKEIDQKILHVILELQASLPVQRKIVTESADELVNPMTGKIYPIKRRTA